MENTKKENGVNPLVKELGEEKRWVNWGLEQREGKDTKVPYNAMTGQKASTIDAGTWSTYDVAKSKSENVGIVFTKEGNLLGVDIDHCIKNGEVAHELAEQINKLISDTDTYVEISPSKTGVHLYLALTEPITLVKNRKGPFEVYTSGRYFTFTGNSFGEEKGIRTVTPQEVTNLLEIIGYPWEQETRENFSRNEPIGDEDLILEKMFTSKNGDEIKKLYDGEIYKYDNDDSVADMALCSHLAFWTGKNAKQMEKLWLGSPLGKREKTQRREDYRDMTINTAIANCKETYSKPLGAETKEQGGENYKTVSQSNKLLDIIDNQKNIEFFHDEQKNAYVQFESEDHKEIWPCESPEAQLWLNFQFWRENKEPLRADVIKNITELFKSRARFEGIEHPLNIRVAQLENELWYDLVDDKWQAIRINKDGWEVVKTPPILFKRSIYNQSQAIPVKGGDVKLLWNYVNIADPNDKLLLLVILISCFIPNFAHVAIVIFGSHGSAKSCLSKILKKVVDPSIVDIVSMPRDGKELAQVFANHYFLFFDNISYVSPKISDILCQIVTGAVFTKRKLYENNTDIIYKIKRPFGMNGINLVSTRPDLLDRSFLLELKRIEPENQKLESEMLEQFEKDLPLILGGIFDALVKVLQIKPTVKLTSLPRMADFASWGSAIAVALGYTQEDFLLAYQHNINSQTNVALAENVVATTVISFMKNRNEWSGTATELLSHLNSESFSDRFINTHERYWPKAPSRLMHRLNEIKPNLQEIGILFNSIPKGHIREITIKNLNKIEGIESEENKAPTTNSLIIDTDLESFEPDGADDTF